MLKNIKSTYFIKILFVFVDEKQKLKIVKSNKRLQKNIGISIINYKLFTGKYIIYESNKIGKEYNGYDDKLIFKGEYLNGKRNGKGNKYYEDGKLEFEGEYLNGKRNGKGKEYDFITGVLIFKGQYLNNKKWIGTGYNEYGGIMYELKNNINGKGKEYVDYGGKLIFEGEYLNGEKNGKGKEYYNNGNLKFEGEYLKDLKWNGKGYDPYNNIVYELKDGKGLIKEYYNNGKLKFYGEYVNGKRNGKGKEYNWYNDELRFEGEYLYNYRLKGKFYIIEKLEYEGEFLYDKKWSGKGYDENGNIIYELINGNGKVKEYSGWRSRLIFEGEYLNGKRNGKGKEYTLKGLLKFEGAYLNGIRHGKGKEYYWEDGKLIFEGEYLNGKRKGKGAE